MSVEAIVEVEDGDVLGEVRAFLRRLMDENAVDALLVPVTMPSGDNVVPTLITDPALLATADPLAPVLPVNAATQVGRLTATGATGRLGVVLRNCEMRALIELVKLQQASLENVVLIGVDCTGTYEVADYADRLRGDEVELRAACRMCERPIPELADVAIGWIGLDGQVMIRARDELAEKLDLSAGEVPASRQQAVETD